MNHSDTVSGRFENFNVEYTDWATGQNGAPTGQPSLVSRLINVEYSTRQCGYLFPTGPQGETYGIAKVRHSPKQLNRSVGWDACANLHCYRVTPKTKRTPTLAAGSSTTQRAWSTLTENGILGDTQPSLLTPVPVDDCKALPKFPSS